ncbi:glycosyltransferase family 2 protein [Thaumasiovibrio sp. DFM-14]|uniref:glycosyltransferase family 2 protein n=1 Tax=Thaumasiovibrio sp. DFM-14 TaxID=3384792 RepID=UPI00399FCBDD
MNDVLITIFTPTYNRVDKLQDCHNSLLSQTSNNFCWQIIDDGSTDETEELVSKWINTSPFNIEYIKVTNGGKCRAINKSLELTNTELWLCLDSDDYLVPDAVDVIESEFYDIRNSDDICGLFSLRGLDDKTPMQGKRIPENIKFCTQGYIRYKLNISPEYAHVFKTEVAKSFVYPSIPNENYFPLSYVYDQIDTTYCYKVIHSPFMICEYRNDGLTKNKRKVVAKNPLGYTKYKKQLVKLAPTFKEKCKAVCTYITGCFLSKTNPFKECDFKLLTFIFLPVGALDYTLRYKLDFKLDMEIKTKDI